MYADHMKSNMIPLSLFTLYSVQFSSVSQSCTTLCDPMECSTPGLPVHYQLPESTQTPVHWVGDAIQPSHPLSSPFPPTLNLSQHQGLFKWVSSLHQMAKVFEFYLFFFFSSFSFNINPSNEHSGLISFRIDCLDLVAIQGTLKSLLQHHSSKASIFQCSAFFIVQLSHPYMTTRKTIALTEYRVLLVCVCVYTCTCALTVSDFFCNLMDCNPPGSSVHGICQGRTLGWVAISSSRGSFQPRDLINCATWEAHSMLLEAHN